MTAAALRLLIVADSVEGGLGSVVLQHVDWFRRLGWEVTLAAGGSPGTDQPGTGRRVLPLPGSARDARAMRATSREIRRLTAETRPDIVHAHGMRSFLAALRCGQRPFVTLHGAGAVESDPPGWRLVRRLGLGIVPRLSAAAFSAAPDVGPGWRFVPHASPLLTSLGRLPFPSTGDPMFLWVGRLDEGKHADVFVRAVAAVAADRPVRGVVAGDGPRREEIARLAQAIGAPIEVIGHADPGPLLARAWGLALFSSHEAVTFVVQEAMWAGRVVVATPLPGIRWLMDDTGFSARDVDEAVLALRQLCDRSTAMTQGERAAARIRSVIAPTAPWPTLEEAYARARPAPAPV